MNLIFLTHYQSSHYLYGQSFKLFQPSLTEFLNYHIQQIFLLITLEVFLQILWKLSIIFFDFQLIFTTKMSSQKLSLSILIDQNAFWTVQKRQATELWEIIFTQNKQPLHEQFPQQVINQLKNQPKRKKRKAKFCRESGRFQSRDRRDIKKYAKFDALNYIQEKFFKQENKSLEQILKLSKLYKVCKRSLKHFFITLGVLKKQRLLQNYLKFFKQNIQQTIKSKYQHRSQFFKTLLSRSLYYSKNAVQLILEDKDLDGIKVAYMQNTDGVKGKTKNPLQMQLCRNLYSTLFPLNNRSQQNDLDIYIQ